MGECPEIGGAEALGKEVRGVGGGSNKGVGCRVGGICPQTSGWRVRVAVLSDTEDEATRRKKFASCPDGEFTKLEADPTQSSN